MSAPGKKRGRILRRGPSLGRKRPGSSEVPLPVRHQTMPQRTMYMLHRKKQGAFGELPGEFGDAVGLPPAAARAQASP